MLKGEPALVDSTSPPCGEKASYYSAVCLETGQVEKMPVEGSGSTKTSVARCLGIHVCGLVTSFISL